MLSYKGAGEASFLRRAAIVMMTCLCATAIVAFIQPANALAAGEDSRGGVSQSELIVRGTDTLQIAGDSFECATVAGLGGSSLYADVTVNNTVLTRDMEYKFDSADDTFGVVQLDTKSSYVAKHSGKITLDFYSAPSTERTESSALLSAKVYAVCMQVNGKAIGSIEESMIGIRTAKESEAELAIQAPTQIVRGDKTYRLVGSNKTAPTLKDNVLWVSYEEVSDTQSITASVTYLDEQGNTLDSDSYILEKDETKTVSPRETVEVNDKVYTPMSAVTKITLSADSPEQRIYCVARAEADKTTQEVKLIYVDSDNKQLMADCVNVGVGGYLYAPATSFSQAKDTAVVHYILTGAVDSTGKEYSADEAKELSLTRDGAKEYTLKYQAEKTKLTYTVNFALVSAGKNGNTNVELAKSETDTVTSTKSASIALPETLEQDGITYKRFGNESSLSYAWSDLENGRQLSDTAYYVSSDVVTPEAYDVTVRYVDAVSGTELGTETLNCKPDGGALSITSPESVNFDGKTYERLGGQSAPITHRFYAPYRTYTVYYAVSGSLSKGDTVVHRTEIIDGGIRYYTIDKTGKVTVRKSSTTSETSSSTNTTGGLIAGTSYTTVVSRDSNTGTSQASNVTAPSGDSAYEERISDTETPLSPAQDTQEGPNFALIAGVVVALLLLVGLIAFAIRKKRASEQANTGMGA